MSGPISARTLEAQMAKLRRGIGRLIDSYAEGMIDKVDFDVRITGLRQRIKGWEEQAEALRDEAAQRVALSLIVSRLEDFAAQVRESTGRLSIGLLQRDLIRLLVKRVEIDRGDITVVFRVAPPPDPGYGGSNEDSLQDCRRSGRARCWPTST